MTNRQRTGWALLAAPFVLVFVLVASITGLLTAIGIFAFSAMVVAAIRYGVEMVA